VYKSYIISLINSTPSLHQQSAQRVLPTALQYCKSFGWQVEIFNAINGYELTPHVWSTYELPAPKQSLNKKNSLNNLPGAQGCFLSHYILWNRCIDLNEPIVVLEDDAEIVAPLNKIDTEYDLLKLHKPRLSGQSKLGFWAAGAFAYWLSPEGAKKLVAFAKINGPGLADKMIVSSVVNWNYINSPIVKLGPRQGSSTQPNKYPYPKFNY
jgi:hypothetical protein